MKLVIIGGGSSYTPELIDGLIRHSPALPVREVCLMDIDEKRLEILSGMCRRMIARHGLDVKVTSTTDQRRALEGADFVNCLIRVGGMEARINDERIPLSFGLVGQETTGPGGMMKALRTIPPMLRLARDIEAVCPDAWLINYTNPSGIVSEALGNHSRAQYVSLCSGPNHWIGEILRLIHVEPARANVDWIGLNHLGFATRVNVDGADVTQAAIAAVSEHWPVDAEWIQTLGAIPASYLRYFYHPGLVVQAARQPGQETRGQQVKRIEAELLRLYADPALDEKPELLDQRGGGGYSDTAFAAMLAIHENRGERQIVQALNRGAVDGLPDGASVEIACVVDRLGPRPIRFGALPLAIRGLVQSVKAYESLTVAAAVNGSRQMAMQALMAHPLVPSWEVAKPLMEKLLEANRPWLPWA